MTSTSRVSDEVEAAYAEMAADETREAAAEEWCEGLAADALPSELLRPDK